MLSLRKSVTRIGLVAAVIGAATVIAAAPAHANVNAVAWVNGQAAYLDDRSGDHNIDLEVRLSGTTLVFDAQYTIDPGAGCTYPVATDTTRVGCSVVVASVEIFGDGGNDFIEIGPMAGVRTELWGSLGDDTIWGNDLGSDDILGGPGADVLSGRGGNDRFYGEPGPDRMQGGAGVDSVSYLYATTTTGVHATADGDLGDDGFPGEQDTIGSDVEDLVGTNYGDVLGGTSADNYILACGGADTIYTYGGNDTIKEGDGDCGDTSGTVRPDYIDAGPGNDWVHYGQHPARVSVDLDAAVGDDGATGEGDSLINVENVGGTPHNDLMFGNSAGNRLNGSGGDDLISGAAGSDIIHGDDGNDIIHGGENDDDLYGDSGSDQLFGNAGSDHCDMGPGGSSEQYCES